MRKFTSVLCVVAISFSASLASAETLTVGLTIVPANGAVRANTGARKVNNRINGNARIIEYFSPNYADKSQKLRQRSSVRQTDTSALIAPR
jgi:hypothetical protein